jgi:hypothetical protein
MTTPADIVVAQMGPDYVNNAGLIRWAPNNEPLPDWYYELDFTDDDYNFTTIDDMANAMNLCCWEIGVPNDQTGNIVIQLGNYDYEFYLNLPTGRVITLDREYQVGEISYDTKPVYEKQCRITLWVPDDWEMLT